MESWQIYHYAIKLLGPSFLQKIYRRSTPHIYTWAAGPLNEIQNRNPIDRIAIMLKELELVGRGDVARAGANLINAALDGHFEPDEVAPSDKGTIDGEAVDVMERLTDVVRSCREALEDDRVDIQEYGVILEKLRRLDDEIAQLFFLVKEKKEI